MFVLVFVFVFVLVLLFIFAFAFALFALFAVFVLVVLLISNWFVVSSKKLSSNFGYCIQKWNFCEILALAIDKC